MWDFRFRPRCGRAEEDSTRMYEAQVPNRSSHTQIKRRSRYGDADNSLIPNFALEITFK